MSSGSTPVKIAGVCLAAVLLAAVLMFRNTQRRQPTNVIHSTAADKFPLCTGESTLSLNGQQPLDEKRHPHSVILSWNTAVPFSSSAQDAIQGYYVYRSFASEAYAEASRISESPVQGTRCVDATVDPEKAYYYVVKAVSQRGTQSGSSVEIRVVVPSL
jgi:hypothetical protein